MKHVLLDTNVLLDVLLRKDDGASARVLEAGANGSIRLYVTPVIMANTHYFLAQLNKHQAAATCDSLLDFISVIPQTGGALRLAFRSGWTDVEDAMQFFAGQRHVPRITCLVSNNGKHFKQVQGMEVLAPADFVHAHLQ